MKIKGQIVNTFVNRTQYDKETYIVVKKEHSHQTIQLIVPSHLIEDIKDVKFGTFEYNVFYHKLRNYSN